MSSPFSISLFFLILGGSLNISAQVSLSAEGKGKTYELINSRLSPGHEAVEASDQCASHPEFGRHIAEKWDSSLNKYVFEFYAHVTPDNDRCEKFDRQRVEIKTYESSPANLKGTLGESITYQWKFKLPAGFQPSSSFTHLHQVKAVGGNDGMPIFTLTARKGKPNQLLLIHDNTNTVAKLALSKLEAQWVEITEKITVGATGTYSLSIKRISDGVELLTYSNPSIMTIRADNKFIRPKWGIYRSLLSPSDLRDEAVRFADFLISEN